MRFPLSAASRTWVVVIAAGFAMAVVAAAGPARADDDDPLLIEDEDEASAASGVSIDDGEDDLLIIDDDDEDQLLIVEDDDQILIIDPDAPEVDAEPAVTGALSRLWESLDLDLEGRLDTAVQALPPAEGPIRPQIGVWVDSTLIPAQNLSFYADAFARFTLDFPYDNTFRWFPIADVYEAYAKINAEVGSVVVGRLVVPWGRTQVAALGDRLNPPDHRRAPGAFPDPVELKQPQWGAQVRTSLGTVALEGVLLTLYEPTEGSLTASDQGGVRGARYQTALVPRTGPIGGMLQEHDRTPFLRRMSILESTSLGVRARQRVGGFDLGATAVWGVDEVPTLHLHRSASRYLVQASTLASDTARPTYDCAGQDMADCLGGGPFLEHGRTASVSADVAYGLQNLVILKAEVLAHPHLAFLPGKTAHVVDAGELKSVRVGHYAMALAAEGGYGDYINLSLEVFNLAWTGLPSGSQMWGVESGAYSQLAGCDIFQACLFTNTPRTVHRFGLGWSAAGSFKVFEQLFDWRWRGEMSPLQLDVLTTAQLRYHLPFFDVFFGGQGNVFVGVPGSPGWMRGGGSNVGLFIGRGA